MALSAKLRTKKAITFQATGEKLPVGILTVGKDITKEQFDAIKGIVSFCEVLEEPAKPGPKPKKVEVTPEPVKEPTGE